MHQREKEREDGEERSDQGNIRKGRGEFLMYEEAKKKTAKLSAGTSVLYLRPFPRATILST